MSINFKFKIGDLVILKASIREIILIDGPGIIIDTTSIQTADLLDDTVDPILHAYIVFFPYCNTEYTIPFDCVELFSPVK